MGGGCSSSSLYSYRFSFQSKDTTPSPKPKKQRALKLSLVGSDGLFGPYDNPGTWEMSLGLGNRYNLEEVEWISPAQNKWIESGGRLIPQREVGVKLPGQ